jgi:hypothetical protein
LASRFVCPVTGIDVGQVSDQISTIAMFSAGFRPFFLLAPLYGVLAKLCARRPSLGGEMRNVG